MSSSPTFQTAESFEIVTVASGARSLRSLQHRETFHPVVGPMAEARGLHAAQQRLVERSGKSGSAPFVVWDVGLGAAANALAVLEAFRDAGEPHRPVVLHSFDRTIAPLEFALSHAGQLGYFEGWESTVSTLLERGVANVPGIQWRLHLADFRDAIADPHVPAPHAVLFDPYSPAANPELWNLETFTAVHQRARADEGCILTSYSRSTAVRVTLLLAGWFVGRGGATGEKDETTVAASRIDLLISPLGRTWLDRVRRSTAPGPLTRMQPARSAIEIAADLSRHPQFTGE